MRVSSTPYPSNSSVLTLFVNEVIPKALAIGNPSRASIPSTVIVNSGSQRFDLYAGPFTRNDQFIVSPFNDAFLYFQVPAGIAKDVLDKLNEKGAHKRRDVEDPTDYARGEVDHRFNAWKRDQYERIYHERSTANLTLGYVTTDVGDISAAPDLQLTHGHAFLLRVVQELAMILFTHLFHITMRQDTSPPPFLPEFRTTRLLISSFLTFSSWIYFRLLMLYLSEQARHTLPLMYSNMARVTY
jgi:hypothetical protein